jgi:EAL domain-containing protein (putative c-di-GMP-specific phosphodiesterase class I)
MKNLRSLIEEAGLSAEELLLEITESAYTEEADQIIERVKELRKMGFLIEMDDFGTGYSSLSMVNRLNIDALKIDMCFIKDAFREKKKDTGMIAIILQIAKYLGVLSIAEGVEDLEQMEQLKALGCDIVQGYCFSRPVSAKDFESFLLRKMMLLEASERKRDRKRQKVTEKMTKDSF